MRAQIGERFRALCLCGEVTFATSSSVHVELEGGSMEVHYPCLGSHRVLLNLMLFRPFHETEKLEEIRRCAFIAFDIPEQESWHMNVGPEAVMWLESDHSEDIRFIIAG